MYVKICGLRNGEDTRIAAEAGADFLGFIFAESSRMTDPVTVREMTNQLPRHIKKVGVFADQPIEDVIRMANEAGVDYIQLHGTESAEYAQRMPFPVIKAFSIMAEADLEKIKGYPAKYFLVDLPKGTGSDRKTLDWELISRAGLPVEKLILAGGLTPENIEEAVNTARPFAVDVASGVETAGMKDPLKIKAFIEKAKKH